MKMLKRKIYHRQVVLFMIKLEHIHFLLEHSTFCMQDLYPNSSRAQQKRDVMHEWMKNLKICMFTQTYQGNVNGMQNTKVESWKKCQKDSPAQGVRDRQGLINTSPECMIGLPDSTKQMFSANMTAEYMRAESISYSQNVFIKKQIWTNMF